MEAAWWVLSLSPRQGVSLQGRDTCRGKLAAVTKQLVLAAHVFSLGTRALTPHSYCLLPAAATVILNKSPLLQRLSPNRNVDTYRSLVYKGDTPPLQGPR